MVKTEYRSLISAALSHLGQLKSCDQKISGGFYSFTCLVFDAMLWRLKPLGVGTMQLLLYCHLPVASICGLSRVKLEGSQISHMSTQDSKDMCLKKRKDVEAELYFLTQP